MLVTISLRADWRPDDADYRIVYGDASVDLNQLPCAAASAVALK